MRRMGVTRAVLLVLLASLLAGCLAGGVFISRETLDQMKARRVPYDEVVKAYGEPRRIQDLGQGTFVAIYVYTHAEPAMAGSNAGGLIGAVAKAASTTLYFDKERRMTDYSTNVSYSRGEPAVGSPVLRQTEATQEDRERLDRNWNPR
jgi:hypothetical protein